MVKKLLVIINLFTFSFLINSQEAQVELVSSKQDVAVNENFQFSLRITSDSENINIEEYPQLDQCIAINNIGQSRSYNMMASNAGIQKTITINFEYICRINKEGKYNIGPFSVNIKNKKVQSNVLAINVTAGGSNANNVSTNSNEKNNETDKSNYYIIKAEQTKKEIYENEFVDLEVSLYSFRDYEVRIRNIKKLNYPPSAWVENLINKNDMLDEKVMINNYVYFKHTIQKERVYISKAGDYEIEPFEIIFDGITSNDFFAIQEPIFLKTKPIYLKVKPLPPQDNAKNFAGAVGDFKISYSLDPQKINPSEASTLNITLEGEGNFHNIDKINFNIDQNIEIYSTKSETKDLDNHTKSKIWEIILVPSKPGKYNIDINDFTYLDVNEKKYKTIKGNSLKLSVAGKAAENSRNINENTASNQEKNIKNENSNEIIKENIASQEINFLKLNIGTKNYLKNIDILFKSQIILYIIFTIIIAMFILLKYYNYSFIKNNGMMIQKKAYKNFSAKINNFYKEIPKTGIIKGIDSLYNAMETYFIHKFEIKSIEFTRKDIESKLKNHLTEEDLKILNNYIKQLNMIRFGENKISTDEFDKIMNELRSFIKNIDINNNNKPDKAI